MLLDDVMLQKSFDRHGRLLCCFLDDKRQLLVCVRFFFHDSTTDIPMEFKSCIKLSKRKKKLKKRTGPFFSEETEYHFHVVLIELHVLSQRTKKQWVIVQRKRVSSKTNIRAVQCLQQTNAQRAG